MASVVWKCVLLLTTATAALAYCDEYGCPEDCYCEPTCCSGVVSDPVNSSHTYVYTGVGVGGVSSLFFIVCCIRLCYWNTRVRRCGQPVRIFALRAPTTTVITTNTSIPASAQGTCSTAAAVSTVPEHAGYDQTPPNNFKQPPPYSQY